MITELAEMGVADHVLESIPGHLSRRTLEHYSHIRIDAQRQALDALDAQRGRVLPSNGNGNGDGNRTQDEEIRAIVELPEGVTSQSRHSLTLSGSPPSSKLLIPFERRDVRVVEGARLESVAINSYAAVQQNSKYCWLRARDLNPRCPSDETPVQFQSTNAQTLSKTEEYQRPEGKTSQQLVEPDEICKTSTPGSNPGGASKFPKKSEAH